jgi:diguanylate cyclase (GGDEF)-like protein
MVDAARGGRNAAALAIVALSALLLTPFLFQRSIAQHRLTYTNALDPARAMTSEALLDLARQIGAIRGYLLTGDSGLLAEYRVARRGQDSALARLAAIRHVDTVLLRQSREFEAAARAWNVSNDLVVSGTTTRAQAAARLEGQQQLYSAALDAGQALERRLIVAVDTVRGRVGTLERRWALATIGLAILAAAGALMVILMMRTSHRQSTLARTDSLTGLYNRLGFDELASRELVRSRRNATSVTLMSFDLDGFKQVNDGRGHAAGDDLLRAVGQAIRGAVREIDVAGRLGGDEFAVLLPDNRAEPAERAAERVRRAIMRALSRQDWPITLSVGAVTADNADITIDEMMHLSDKLMYAVKNDGKNGMKHELVARH